MLRIVFQSTPEKKGWFLTSSDEFLPSRFSGSRIMLRAWCEGTIVSITISEQAATATALLDQVHSLGREPNVLGKVQLVLPVNDLAVRVVGVLGAEGRAAGGIRASVTRHTSMHEVSAGRGGNTGRTSRRGTQT